MAFFDIIFNMRLRKETISSEEILLISKVSDAFAHPARIRIFRFIMQRNKNRIPVYNKDVVLEFDYSQATISQHIDKLIIGGLVKVKKDKGRSAYFANIGLLTKYTHAVKNFD